jgi:hypothetical protein
MRSDPMEYFRRSCRPVVGALHTIVSEAEFASSLQVHHQRWTQANPITGLPYALVRSIEQHQGSRRVGPPRRVSFWQRLLRRIINAPGN